MLPLTTAKGFAVTLLLANKFLLEHNQSCPEKIASQTAKLRKPRTNSSFQTGLLALPDSPDAHDVILYHVDTHFSDYLPASSTEL
ncbi:hypothetical protein scyTo_0001917 [Scyliorhinus torazame]|uniref:Uncharacterized protein n=1 Tax=Scyliorhinus torazame TaxID=75743 RepID=A0A401PGN6_SCYTO|nr:hypothetical protein [Scyliorhinus torazame]